MRLWFFLLPLVVAAVDRYDLINCVYFCKTSDGRFFCCGGGNSVPTRPVIHPGSCPLGRRQCPGTTIRRILPTTCAHDGQCPFTSKCCYDVCLQWTVCKPALPRRPG